jgi:hypothetical protein
MSQGSDHGLQWYGSCSDSACVEVARAGDDVYVRNSQRPHEVTRFTIKEWEAFAAGMRAGAFPF